MRLINVHTMCLEEFFGDDIPPYCILSHRWTGDEISYKDFRKGRRKDSAGYQKIVHFCNLVKQDMLRYDFFRNGELPWSMEVAFLEPIEGHIRFVWVDTCTELRRCRELAT